MSTNFEPKQQCENVVEYVYEDPDPAFVIIQSRIQWLLQYEEKNENKNPDSLSHLYNERRGTFEVPFQTESYKEWWAAGPQPEKANYSSDEDYEDDHDYYEEDSNEFLSDIDEIKKDSESKTIEGDKDCSREDEEERLDKQEFRKHVKWVKQYLLKVESKGKDPPIPAFEMERNRFRIPFVTEKFKEWWNAPRLEEAGYPALDHQFSKNI